MAARRAALRAVGPGEPPPLKPKMMTLSEAIEDGNLLDVMLAQRRNAVASLNNLTGPALAAMHRQIFLQSKEIESLKALAKQEAEEDGDESAEDEDLDASSL